MSPKLLALRAKIDGYLGVPDQDGHGGFEPDRRILFAKTLKRNSNFAKVSYHSVAYESSNCLDLLRAIWEAQ